MRTYKAIQLALWMVPALLVARPAAGQAGFEADRLMPCMVEPGLVAACEASVPPAGLSAAIGLDYAHHLLAVEIPGVHGPRWLVQRRLTLRTALGFSAGRTLLLSAGLDAAAYQRGAGTDGLGAPIERGPAIGRSWLGFQWIPSPAYWPLAAGFRIRLVLPSAGDPGLAGPTRVQWRLAAVVSADLGWIRPALNLGVAVGEQARYRNLIRDESLQIGAGLELGGPDWPLAGLAEIEAVTRLRDPFAHRVDQTLEFLTGLSLGGHGPVRILLVAGFGLAGPSAPGARALTLIRWTPGEQKRPWETE